MKISPVALGLTLGILWGASMCGIAIIHAIFPGYGSEYFQLIGSIYPGISGSSLAVDLAFSAVYGIVDGFVFGLLIAWIYNFVLTRVVQRR